MPITLKRIQHKTKETLLSYREIYQNHEEQDLQVYDHDIKKCIH